MPKFLAVAALLLFAPALGMAQDATHPSRGQAYLLFGVAKTNAEGRSFNTTMGFGGEGLISGVVGVGAEAELLSPVNMGAGSVDLSYHFVSTKRPSNLEPFAIGGLSIYFGERRALYGGNLGCGLNSWVTKHVALRLEVRENFGPGEEFRETFGFTRLTAFRFGLAFR